ncbi:MAG TPA: lytic transglycosylase domain-containing protein [Kiritimatiellia bacterium]|nr:lytic transglycosylase domain-containing protein [Kiritimatiellia bacterium]
MRTRYHSCSPASRIIVLLFVSLGLLLLPAGAQSDVTWEDTLEMGADMLDEAGLSLENLQPTMEDWQLFWNDILGALESDSLEDLAWVLPYADGALNLLGATEEGRPYADWLRQRLDYFDVARNVLKALPVGPPPVMPPRPVAKPTVRTVLLPPPRPKPATPPSPQVARGRTVMARSGETWRRKVASRPAPASAAALVPRLKDVFRDEGVPAQWVWLAEVESSMNPAARSPVGAAGLFQFMPATAQRFGLSTSPTDERLVPERSARAAAKYLKLLHKQFDSWPLALAAYNAGEGRVSRTLKSKKATTFEAIEDALPLETQMYVPKVMATVALRENVDPATLPGPSAMWLPAGVDVVAWVFSR